MKQLIYYFQLQIDMHLLLMYVGLTQNKLLCSFSW